LLAKIAELDEQFPDYARLLEDLARLLQRIAVCQVVGVTDYDDGFDSTMLESFANELSAEDVQLFYQIAVTGRRDLHLAPDPRGGVEMTLLRMLAFQPGGEAQPKAPGSARQAASKPASTRQTQRQPTATSTRSAASWQDPDWSSLIPKLGLTGLNRQLASNCAFLRRDGQTIFLALDHRSESFLTRDRHQALAKALGTHFDEALKLDITVGPPEKETPVQEEIRKEDELHAAARRGLEADPNIAALKDLFGAELVADSVEPLAGTNGTNPGVGR
jgi:DNA polymerase-3 subunit gamma/tau